MILTIPPDFNLHNPTDFEMCTTPMILSIPPDCEKDPPNCKRTPEFPPPNFDSNHPPYTPASVYTCTRRRGKVQEVSGQAGRGPGFSAHAHRKWVPRALTLSSRWQGTLSVSRPLLRRRVLSFSFCIFSSFLLCCVILCLFRLRLCCLRSQFFFFSLC